MTGGDGQGVLQQAQIVFLEPDLTKLVSDFQSDGVAVCLPGLQSRKPHFICVWRQFGTEMFLRHTQKFFR